MNRHQLDRGSKQVEPISHREMPLSTTFHISDRLGKKPRALPFLAGFESLTTGHNDNHFIDGINRLINLDAPKQNRATSQRRQQLVEAHASAAASRHNDRRIHKSRLIPFIAAAPSASSQLRKHRLRQGAVIGSACYFLLQ